MNYLKIESTSLSNGLGWRVVLWCAGCYRHCPGCHNPESWDENGGKPFTQNEMDLLLELLKPQFVKGLTLSGGDPLFINNRQMVAEICRTVKERLPEKDIWIYTGFNYEEVKDLEVMKYADVMVDGSFMQELRDVSLAFKGSSNQRIIDVPASRRNNQVALMKIE